VAGRRIANARAVRASHHAFVVLWLAVELSVVTLDDMFVKLSGNEDAQIGIEGVYIFAKPGDFSIRYVVSMHQIGRHLH